MFLVIMDAYSKWLEVHATSTATSQITMDKFKVNFYCAWAAGGVGYRQWFSVYKHGIWLYCKRNGIKYVTSSSYHPSSNRLAERTVQALKTRKGREIYTLECTIAFSSTV